MSPHATDENSGNGNPAWRTPPALAAHIVRRFGITYDAFADHDNAIAPRYSTIEGTFQREAGWLSPAERLGEPGRTSLADEVISISTEDGLSRSWRGERVFFNPPYSRGWSSKLADKIDDEREHAAIMVGLLMADTSTLFWREFVIPTAETIVYLPRVRYVLSPEDLAAWREAGFEREADRVTNEIDRDRIRSRWEKRTPDSPNFGSAVVVFRGAAYPVE